MAVPVTDRTSPDFSSLGLLQAAVLGLTDARYNTTRDLQPIPNMDGFPNGRRLEDDVTRIELQAVGGIVLAVLGLGYDDYEPVTATTTLCAVRRGLSLDFTLDLPEGAAVTDVVSATYGSGTGTNCSNFAFGTCQIDVTDKVKKLLDTDPSEVGFDIDVEHVDPDEVLQFILSLNNPCPGSVQSLQVVLAYQLAGNLATQDLVDVLNFTTGIEGNDTTFQTSFPFEQKPWNGFLDGAMNGGPGSPVITTGALAPKTGSSGMKLAPPPVTMKQVVAYPNPASQTATFRYRVNSPSEVSVSIFDGQGNLVATPLQKQPRQAGVYELPVNVSKLENGIYYARVLSGGTQQMVKFVVGNK
jgi:hypothetical protein